MNRTEKSQGRVKELRRPATGRFKRALAPSAPSVRANQRVQRINTILAAARTVFAEDGYAAFSSRRVAAVAGLRLSNLQHYFDTHEKLRLAAIDSLIGRYPARYRAILADDSLSARRRLELLVDDTLDAVSDPNVCGFIFQAFALGVHDTAVGSLVESHYAEYASIVAEMLRQNRPGLSVEAATELATVFASQMDGLMFFEFRGGTRMTAFERLRTLVKQRLMALVDG